MSRVEGTVLVTGGTGALGTAVVGTLLEDGCQVVSTWVVEAERDKLVEELGERESLELIEVDVLDATAVAAAVKQAAGGPEPLKGVVNLVGGYAGGERVHESDPETFERMLRLNTLPTYLVTRAALPYLVEADGGSVVGVSAKAAVEPTSGNAGYITAKAGVLALMRAVAAEYGDEGVRANAILPSVIDTEANRRAMPDSDHSKWVSPIYIARLIRFLCSADSTPISGAAIPIYGGS